jgi:hypothetical protein
MTSILVLEVAKALCCDDGREWYCLSAAAMGRYIEVARAALFLGVKPRKPVRIDDLP